MDIIKLKEFADKCTIDGEKIVISNNIAKTLDFVKQNYGFDMLKEIIAIDNAESGIELIYSLYSTVDEESLLISMTVFNETESVSKIFDSAIADEKEIYDLFGINFIGNEELKRLYMPESWIGNPLKKDYKEEDVRLNWNDQV